jgi:hypothetical protein
MNRATDPNLAAAGPFVADRHFDLALKFNLFPALYVHASWVETMFGGFGPQRADTEDGRSEGADSVFWVRQLSSALLRQHELDRLLDFDFTDACKRSALLNMREGLQLSAFVCALLLREPLRRIALAPQVAALQRHIGRETYVQALRWPDPVPVLTGLPPVLVDADELLQDAQAADPQRWLRRVARLWLSLMPATAIGLLQRLRLKLPRAWRVIEPWRLDDIDRLQIGALFAQGAPRAAPDSAWVFAPGAQGRRQP